MGNDVVQAARQEWLTNLLKSAHQDRAILLKDGKDIMPGILWDVTPELTTVDLVMSAMQLETRAMVLHLAESTDAVMDDAFYKFKRSVEFCRHAMELLDKSKVGGIVLTGEFMAELYRDAVIGYKTYDWGSNIPKKTDH